jgi:hypothetical protein
MTETAQATNLRTKDISVATHVETAATRAPEATTQLNTSQIVVFQGIGNQV